MMTMLKMCRAEPKTIVKASNELAEVHVGAVAQPHAALALPRPAGVPGPSGDVFSSAQTHALACLGAIAVSVVRMPTGTEAQAIARNFLKQAAVAIEHDAPDGFLNAAARYQTDTAGLRFPPDADPRPVIAEMVRCVKDYRYATMHKGAHSASPVIRGGVRVGALSVDTADYAYPIGGGALGLLIGLLIGGGPLETGILTLAAAAAGFGVKKIVADISTPMAS
jgi:hypothetical protein